MVTGTVLAVDERVSDPPAACLFRLFPSVAPCRGGSSSWTCEAPPPPPGTEGNSRSGENEKDHSKRLIAWPCGSRWMSVLCPRPAAQPCSRRRKRRIRTRCSSDLAGLLLPLLFLLVGFVVTKAATTSSTRTSLVGITVTTTSRWQGPGSCLPSSCVRRRRGDTQGTIAFVCAAGPPATRTAAKPAPASPRPLDGSSRTVVGLMMRAPQQLGAFEPLNLLAESSQPQRPRRRVVLENWLGPRQSHPRTTTTTSPTTVPFDTAWKRQQVYWQQHADRLSKGQEAGSSFYGGRSDDDDVDATASTHGVDRVIFLQHDPVYTLGTGSDPSYILTNDDQDKDGSTTDRIPVVRMDRGGEVTYHGPGQLVAYPILDLRGYRQDIHWYMRALEECVLVALRDMGIKGSYRDDETTGVWIDQHKVAAMGVKCRRWVTMHGLAVNVEPQSLRGFEGIVPCGLEGRKVGCVSQFAGRHVAVEEFAVHLRAAMEHVFQIQLCEARQLGGPIPEEDTALRAVQ